MFEWFKNMLSRVDVRTASQERSTAGIIYESDNLLQLLIKELPVFYV